MDTKILTRTESDLIGAREIPASALYGVQTLRGIKTSRLVISTFVITHSSSMVWQ